MNKFTDDLIRAGESHGITLENLETQFEHLTREAVSINVVRPCAIGDGIHSTAHMDDLDLPDWDDIATRIRIQKFVPASGAATRMFKSVNQARLHRDEPSPDCDRFFTELDRFPFATLIPHDVRSNGQLAVLNFLLTEEGLDYLNQPKGLIPFHRYGDTVFTPVQEHIEEVLNWMRPDGPDNALHFTVQASVLSTFKSMVDAHLAASGVDWLTVTYSVQDPSTDTIALAADGSVFRSRDGNPVFRPGGHGALIQNLNQLDTDLIIIRNIDNIQRIPERLDAIPIKKRQISYIYYLATEIQKLLTADAFDEVSAAGFLEREFGLRLNADRSESKLRDLLNRPIRVCGMVRNEGQPGGGPFWVRDATGIETTQIVEKAQFNLNDSKVLEMFNRASHFNPVDILCWVRDVDGNRFDLSKFTDPDTAFVSSKTIDGREATILEWPGLWNGSMAGWLTAFMDVPAWTFSPVKSVMDLIEAPHQE